MIIQFNFKNYKSFRDEATLDLSATKMTEFSERVVSIGGEKILPVAAMYGANASGKSNVYGAFEYMSDYVVNSFKYGDEVKNFDEIRPHPFMFDSESENSDTSFEVYFTVPGDKTEKSYNYGFCVGKEGITEEWLNYKAKTARKYKSVFYRDEKNLDLSGIPKASRENISVALEKQVLIVSLGAKLRIARCKLVREKVVKFFASFDETIKGFEVTKLPQQDDSKDEHFQIDALHKVIGSDELAKIPLQNESAGTLKMFALYPELQEVLDQGGVFFIDELNARLHPLLVRNFILTFLNAEINVNHAQLVFTTHDTWQLSNQLLRRDEIWFTEKDNDGLSTLYSLADFVDEDGSRIRKDESYEKNYLLGKYGAIPSLKTIEFFKGK